jgi:hypothetical protein
MLGNVSPRQEIPAVGTLDDIAQPFSARFGTNQNEEGFHTDGSALLDSSISG